MCNIKVETLLCLSLLISSLICNTIDHNEGVQEIPQPDPQLSEFVWFTTDHDYHGYNNYIKIHPVILHNHLTPETETNNQEKEPGDQKMQIRL